MAQNNLQKFYLEKKVQSPKSNEGQLIQHRRAQPTPREKPPGKKRSEYPLNNFFKTKKKVHLVNTIKFFIICTLNKQY